MYNEKTNHSQVMTYLYPTCAFDIIPHYPEF